MPTCEAVPKLTAARLAAHVVGVPTILLARTDAEAADLVTRDVDDNGKTSLTGERTVEGFYRTKKGFDQAVSRGLAYAEGLVRDRHAGSQVRQGLRRRDARQVPGQDAGLQLQRKLPGFLFGRYQLRMSGLR